MEMQYVVMIVVAGITAAGGWVGNHISNKPKREESQHNKINLIITHLEKNWKKCEERYSKLCEKYKAVLSENRELKRKLDELKKGGDK